MKGKKMDTAKKITLSITLNAWEAALLEKATGIAIRHHKSIYARPRGGYHRMLRMAFWAFMRAAIVQGSEINSPVMATLRAETREEMDARVNGEVPGDEGANWRIPNRWN
ncbi:MAG TPA: hypothetical protein VG938_07585 [Verrucomicrobiae bacterium]|nr:hypothetical protein [Verrucomicrobiae bacterium]